MRILFYALYENIAGNALMESLLSSIGINRFFFIIALRVPWNYFSEFSQEKFPINFSQSRNFVSVSNIFLVLGQTNSGLVEST